MKTEDDSPAGGEKESSKCTYLIGGAEEFLVEVREEQAQSGRTPATQRRLISKPYTFNVSHNVHAAQKIYYIFI